MSKTVLARQCFFSRPRRQFSTSSVKRTSTSPQRYNMSEPAVRSGNVKKFSDIPGPLALPIMRHHAHVLPRIGCFHHTVGLGLLEGLQQRYGDLVRFAKATRSRPVLYVFDPELMKEVYDSNMTVSPQWSQSPLNEHRKNADTKCPMQSDESKAVWTALRTLLQDDSFLRNFDKAFDDIAVDVTRRLEGLRHAGNALNEELQTEIYRWAIEIIGVLIFGMRLGCLDGNVHVPTEENRNPEKTSMDDHIKYLCSLTKKSERDLSPAERFVRCSLDVANENYLVRSEDTLRQESETFNEALKTFDKHYSLTDHFLVRALENLNNEELKAEQVLLNKLRPLERRILPLAADAFLAGVDPTAISMLYELSLHAARQQRVHDEAGWARAVRGEGLAAPDMPYAAACVREALRLYPATGGVVRRSVGELSVAGYEVPEGVDIVLAHGVSSKLEKEWGRAKSFIPERWHSDGWRPLNASRAHRCASMPFGQTCPAAGVVNKMLSSLAIRVLDTYRIEWHGAAPRVTAAGVNKIQRPYYFVLQNAG
ncbi:probable cytochrome P450 301a1, mitochondrial isoform X2 [Danaus plexippus]|uniref:probable cytochrome P450 301a1, mitochondrial isoform X2 n=1 Tax=Danaus plexippus TaxID=13037 RepID=UPI002AB0C3A2|nr:probable cytochrome P450 301a1, mitochondrial isoform X2 [Danaus plexippus]